MNPKLENKKIIDLLLRLLYTNPNKNNKKITYYIYQKEASEVSVQGFPKNSPFCHIPYASGN